MVDPMTIPSSWLRTSGVNQAVRPSNAPRTAPSTNPRTILFIASSARESRLRIYTTLLAFRLSAHGLLSRAPQNEQGTHDEIREHHEEPNTVSNRPTPKFRKRSLRIGINRQSVKIRG